MTAVEISAEIPTVARIFQLDRATDSRLECYRDLHWDKKPRVDAKYFIAEGRLCVRRLIESRYSVESVLVQSGKEDEVAGWIDDDTPVYSLPIEQMKSLVGFDFHRGMMACGNRPQLASIDQLDFGPISCGLAVAVIGVTERENLGSILRTAAALGVDRILIGPNTADPFSRRTIRVSMGTVFRQHLYDLNDPTEQLRGLQTERGFRTIATTLDPDATPLRQWKADLRHTILVMGNEASGVDRELQQAATDRVIIPMQLGTNSLNVSVAAAIFLYELTNR